MLKGSSRRMSDGQQGSDRMAPGLTRRKLLPARSRTSPPRSRGESPEVAVDVLGPNLASQRKLPPRSRTSPPLSRSRSPDVKARTDGSPQRQTNGFVVEREVLKRDPVEPVSRRVGDWLLKSDVSLMVDLEEEINAWVVPPSPTRSQTSPASSSAFLSHEFQGSLRSHPLAGSSDPSRKDIMKFDHKWEPELRSKYLALANAKVSCSSLSMRPVRWPAHESMRTRTPDTPAIHGFLTSV